MKQNEVVRLIYKNGKTVYYRNEPMGGAIKYDLYELEASDFYIDIIEQPNYIENIHIQKDVSINTMGWDVQVYEDELSYNCVMKNPLLIFENKELLKNQKLLHQLLNEYPLLTMTLLKKEYKQYISTKCIVKYIKKYNLYPNKYLYSELIEALLCEKDYCYTFVINFIEKSNLCIYEDFKNDKNRDEIIREDEFEIIVLMIPLIKNFFQNRDNFNCILQNMSGLDNLWILYNNAKLLGIERYVDFIKDFEEKEGNIEEEYKNKYHTIYENKCFELDGYLRNSKDFNSIARLVLEILYMEEKIDYSNRKKEIDFRVIEKLPKHFLENKEVLIEFAKYQIPLSSYSMRYSLDRDIVFNELKYNPSYLDFIPVELFNDRRFVLLLRHIFPNILQYVDEELLDDSYFMSQYIESFGTYGFFKLGNTLCLDKTFLIRNIYVDHDILFYCHDSLYDDGIFMHSVLIRDYNNVRFLSKRLRNNQIYMSNFRKNWGGNIFDQDKDSTYLFEKDIIDAIEADMTNP